MSGQHTPGPWDAWITRSAYSMTGPAAAASMTATHALREAGYESLFVEMSSRSYVCPALAFGDTQEQARANARLIAAAPELLEALNLFTEFANLRREELGELSPEMESVAAKARVAIAKAQQGVKS